MKRSLMLLCLAPLAAFAQQAEIGRALIERDRQSAEFARPELRALHAREDLEHRPARADERSLQAWEREAFLLGAPVRPEGPRVPAAPLPLPGGPRHGVDPVPVQGLGG